MRLAVYLLVIATCMAAAGADATPRELFGGKRLRSALTSVSAGVHVARGVAGRAQFSCAPEAFHLVGSVKERGGLSQNIDLFEDKP
jgi:hypothetical protein